MATGKDMKCKFVTKYSYQRRPYILKKKKKPNLPFFSSWTKESVWCCNLPTYACTTQDMGYDVCQAIQLEKEHEANYVQGGFDQREQGMSK